MTALRQHSPYEAPYQGYDADNRQNYAMALVGCLGGTFPALLPLGAAGMVGKHRDSLSLHPHPLQWDETSIELMSPHCLHCLARDYFKGDRTACRAPPGAALHPGYLAYYYPGTHLVLAAIHTSEGACAALVDARDLALHTATGRYSPQIDLHEWIPFARWAQHLPMSRLQVGTKEDSAFASVFSASQKRVIGYLNNLRKHLDTSGIREKKGTRNRKGAQVAKVPRAPRKKAAPRQRGRLRTPEEESPWTGTDDSRTFQTGEDTSEEAGDRWWEDEPAVLEPLPEPRLEPLLANSPREEPAEETLSPFEDEQFWNPSFFDEIDPFLSQLPFDNKK